MKRFAASAFPDTAETTVEIGTYGQTPTEGLIKDVLISFDLEAAASWSPTTFWRSRPSSRSSTTPRTSW